MATLEGIVSINDATQNVHPPFQPTQEEADFLAKVYNDFVFDYQQKYQIWEILNNRTVEQYWQDSNYDYNNIVLDDPSDPVTQYSSGITRDKANTLITNLTLQLLSPTVIAQNENQEVDQIISHIARPILEWQHNNDGRPSESGDLKNSRYIHKMVVEGTVHIQDDIDPDTGKLVSSVIPNEEVFIPNYYQPNLQLQSHFQRVTQFTSFQEMEAEFGDLPNWEYVVPGNLGWINTIETFKERYKATVVANQLTAIRCWYPVPRKDLKALIASGKLPKGTTKAKYFNVILNGVPMFEPKNLMPYYHGDYPVTKGVNEFFSPSEFYWGNSMPNKCRQDKKYLDGWKTLIRYKAKLSAAPTIVNFTGQHIEGDVLIPGNIIDLPSSFDPNKFAPLQGIAQGITTGDIEILKDTVSDIERATSSAQTSGVQPTGNPTAREMMIVEGNAQKTMMGFAQQVAFIMEARAFPILKASFQFLPRMKVQKISIPSQVFPDGRTGTLEVVFQNLPEMTKEQELEESFKLLEEELQAGVKGHIKATTKLDKEYIQNLDFYCKATAESLPKENSAMRQAKAQMKWETYVNFPQYFNVKAAARKLVRENGDDEGQMIVDDSQQPVQQPGQLPGQPMQPQGQPPQQGQYQTPPNPALNMAQRQTNNLNTGTI